MGIFIGITFVILNCLVIFWLNKLFTKKHIRKFKNNKRIVFKSNGWFYPQVLLEGKWKEANSDFKRVRFKTERECEIWFERKSID